VASNSRIYKGNKETPESSNAGEFLCPADRSCVSVKMEAILSASCNEVKTKLLIAVLFSSYTQSVKFRKYLRCHRGIVN
jgi:hypothetical protein